ISGAVRYLETIGLVSRSRTSGTRHDVYAVQDDAWIDAMMRHDDTYAPIIGALDRALADLPDDDPARHRIDNAREFLVWIGVELDDLVIRWRAHLAERER
ncbi:MAG: transcriptional regulator TrmB, partial [Nocardioidaceae bacterium]|nr:transcriptional regulator TrmB [Nocardioidaceae bacterium]